MDIGQRIRKLRIEAGMTLEELSQIVGVSRQTLSRYETGVIGNIPSDKIESVADALETTPSYIMGWTDDPYDYENDPGNLLDVIPTEVLKELRSLYGEDNEKIIKAWNTVLEPDPEFSSPMPTDNVIQFHPIGTVAAGYNSWAIEELEEDSIDIPVSYLKGRPSSDYFLLKVKGDSMYPLYHDGDHVLVLKQDSLERPGEIGVVLYDGDQATLKKMEFGDGWMRLVPINPTYKELMIEKADLNRCRILGVPRVLVRDM